VREIKASRVVSSFQIFQAEEETVIFEQARTFSKSRIGGGKIQQVKHQINEIGGSKARERWLKVH